MATLVKYRVYCENEMQFVETAWIEEDKGKPEVCPHNNTHAIDETRTTIIDIRNSNKVSISEEDVATGGHFSVQQLIFTTPANSTVNHVFPGWKIPLNVKATAIPFEEVHRGDVMTLCVAPNTIVGLLTQPVEIGDTVLKVTPTAVQYIERGFQVSLFNGFQTELLGIAINVNKITNEIEVERPSTQAFAISPYPCYIRLTIIYADKIVIHPFMFDAGKDTMGSTYVPANTPIHFEYENKHPTLDKSIYVFISTFY